MMKPSPIMVKNPSVAAVPGLCARRAFRVMSSGTIRNSSVRASTIQNRASRIFAGPWPYFTLKLPVSAVSSLLNGTRLKKNGLSSVGGYRLNGSDSRNAWRFGSVITWWNSG